MLVTKCTMFATVKKGLAYKYITPSKDPVERPFVDCDWTSCVGDLADLRSRLGVLCPMSYEFIEEDIKVMPPLQNKERYNVNLYMQKMYNKQSVETSPYFRDPYGRDTPSGRVQLLINCRVHAHPGKRRHHEQRIPDASLWQTKHARVQLLHSVMEDTAKRREEERQTDAMVWGQSVAEEAAPTTKAAPRKPDISSYLYQPRNIHHKSEFTKRMEVAMALSRKKDKEDAIIKRLVDHKNHGFKVRIQKLESDSRLLEDLKVKISEKESKSSQMHLTK